MLVPTREVFLLASGYASGSAQGRRNGAPAKDRVGDERGSRGLRIPVAIRAEKLVPDAGAPRFPALSMAALNSLE